MPKSVLNCAKSKNSLKRCFYHQFFTETNYASFDSDWFTICSFPLLLAWLEITGGSENSHFWKDRRCPFMQVNCLIILAYKLFWSFYQIFIDILNTVQGQMLGRGQNISISVCFVATKTWLAIIKPERNISSSWKDILGFFLSAVSNSPYLFHMQVQFS